MVAGIIDGRGFVDNYYTPTTATEDTLNWDIWLDSNGATITGNVYKTEKRRKIRCKRKQPRKRNLPAETNEIPSEQPKYKKFHIILGIKKTKIAKSNKIDVYNRKILFT